MCISAKASITAWWILVLISLMLWYRNLRYDRVLAPVIFVLGLIQLFEFGVHNGADAHQAGQLIYIALWLQCLILAIGTFLFITQDNILKYFSIFNLVLFSVIFLLALTSSFYLNLNAEEDTDGRVVWTNNRNGSFLGMYGILYLFGIFFPLLLILASYNFKDIGIIVLILYLIVSALYSYYVYPDQFGSMWCYLSVGFAFLAWFVGIFSDSANRESN